MPFEVAVTRVLPPVADDAEAVVKRTQRMARRANWMKVAEKRAILNVCFWIWDFEIKEV